MSELRVDTIKPSFNTKVVITPGFVVRDIQDTDQFEVTSSGEIKVLGPLNVGSVVSNTPGSAGQLLSSQGPGLPPVWVPAIPFGGIIMWYGSVASIPSGWVLCDGVARTILGQTWTPPNLRDRFVVGAGNTYPVNTTGGSKDAIIPAHTHTLNDPGHRHGNWLVRGTGGITKNGNSQMIAECRGETDVTESGPVIAEGFSGNQIKKAKTGITIASAGESVTDKNLPPYYALCYIMRVPTL